MTLPKGWIKCHICNEIHKELWEPDDWTTNENDAEWVRRHSKTRYYKRRMNYSAKVLGVPSPYPEEDSLPKNVITGFNYDRLCRVLLGI